jgi:hypothetical protein
VSVCVDARWRSVIVGPDLPPWCVNGCSHMAPPDPTLRTAGPARVAHVAPPLHALRHRAGLM